MIRVSQLNAPSCTDESAITFGLILEYWIMMNAIDTVTNLDGLSRRRLGKISHCQNPVS